MQTGYCLAAIAGHGTADEQKAISNGADIRYKRHPHTLPLHMTCAGYIQYASTCEAMMHQLYPCELRCLQNVRLLKKFG